MTRYLDRRRALQLTAASSAALLLPPRRVEAAPLVGETAPSFSGTALGGGEISLNALRGHVVVLNFWATWCGPCKKELPLLDAAARKPEWSDLYIVAVTTDADRAPPDLITDLQKVLSFPLLKRFRGTYEPIGGAIPTNYVIDRNGILRYAQAGALDDGAINDLLGPLLATPAPETDATVV